MPVIPPFLRLEWRRIYDDELPQLQELIENSIFFPVAVVVLYSLPEDKTTVLASCCGWTRSVVEKACAEVNLSVYAGLEEQVEIMLTELNRRLRDESTPPEKWH